MTIYMKNIKFENNIFIELILNYSECLGTKAYGPTHIDHPTHKVN